MKTYGYVRVSTTQQKTQRQIDNIKALYPDAIIKEEKQSAKDIDGRSVFKELLGSVKSGDRIIFDEVSRMSRNAEEGYNLYMNLIDKGVNLVFLKQPHINSDEFKRRTQNHMSRISLSDKKIDKLLNGILDLVADFEKENLKENIKLAFEQAENERLLLIRRVTEGKEKSEKHQGRPEGSKNKGSAKADLIKKIIREQSKDFEGRFSDTKIMREYLSNINRNGKGIARNTYYKYKKELTQEMKSDIR